MPSTIEPRRAVRFSSRARMPGASTRSDRVRRFTASVAMPACFCAASPSETVPSAAAGAWASGPPRPLQARQTATTATSATAADDEDEEPPALDGAEAVVLGGVDGIVRVRSWQDLQARGEAGTAGDRGRPRPSGRGPPGEPRCSCARRPPRAGRRWRPRGRPRGPSVSPPPPGARGPRPGARGAAAASRAARTRMAASARARVTVASSSRSAARASASARATARPFRSKTGTVATRPTTAVLRPVVRL